MSIYMYAIFNNIMCVCVFMFVCVRAYANDI